MITIDDNIKKIIINSIKNYKKDNEDGKKEIEFRIKNVNYEEIQHIIELLDNSTCEKEIINYTTEYYYKNNRGFTYRKLIFEDYEEYETKMQMIRHPFKISINNKKIDIIFAVSSEKKVLPEFFKDEKPYMTVRKERTSYIYNYYRIDITNNNSKPDTIQNYELELEITDCQYIIDSKKIDIIFSPIEDLFKNNITNYNYNDISLEIKAISKNIYTTNKPTTFHRKYIKDLPLYAYTLKEDGIRCNLYRNSQGSIYKITNNNNITKIYDCISPVNIKYNEIILDCEYNEGLYYTIDCIYYNHKNINCTNMNYIQRQILLEKIVNKLQIAYIKHKKVYLNWDLFCGYKSWFEVKRLKYDGFIFTPINSSYDCKTIYKFKDLNTIDFLVKDKQVYVVNSHKENVIFDYENSGKTDYINDKDEIVEMYYNKTEKLWKYLRTRTDKNTPNYIDIAKDNFDVILENITLSDVQDYMKDYTANQELYYLNTNEYKIIKSTCLLKSISLSLFGSEKSEIILSPRKDLFSRLIKFQEESVILSNINLTQLFILIDHENIYDDTGHIINIIKKLYPIHSDDDTSVYTKDFVILFKLINEKILNKKYSFSKLNIYNLDFNILFEIEQKINITLIIISRTTKKVIYKGIRREKVIILLDNDLIVINNNFFLDMEDKEYIDYLYSKQSDYNQY